ncbi:MAG: putative lipoprotein [Myxococcaceae bacterium]|nr:putative lipoprotein [Myxococcaceae bacterium]
MPSPVWDGSSLRRLMNARSKTLTWVLAGLLGLMGCRDEQAGPRNRPPPQQQASPQAPGQAPAAGMKTLEAAPADLTFKSGATWAGGTVEYLGSKVEPARPTAGQQVRLSHYFRALKAPPQGWTFFLHVVDASSGQQLGNADHELQGGAAPLGSWPVGKVIEDVHVIQMPNYAGALQLVLGFWQGEARLPVDDRPLPAQPAHDGQQRMFGPRLESPQQQPLPEYRVPRASKPPAIDGKLDDEIWKAAPMVTLNSSMDGSPVSKKTTARMLYDDKFLYVAFECEDADVWGSLRKKDDPIYTEDAVEIFIDANGDGKTYNELQVSPHNVNFDAAFVARRSDLPEAMKWESAMKSAVTVRGTIDNDADQDEGWSAEMQIPLEKLMEVPRLPVQKGDTWRFNLYRLEHLVRRQQIEGQSFSPLFAGDFHHLPRFGRLIFE